MNLGKQTGATFQAPRPLSSAQLREQAAREIAREQEPATAPVSADQPVLVTA